MVKKRKDSNNSSILSNPKPKKMTAREREELLIENFVGLQRAMTNLSIRFESLTGQINRLLEIFELAAKNFVSGENEEKNKDVLEKINSLLEQNKTIAHGLVLIEDKIRNKQEIGHQLERPSSSNLQQMNSEVKKIKQLPRF